MQLSKITRKIGKGFYAPSGPLMFVLASSSLIGWGCEHHDARGGGGVTACQRGEEVD